MLSLAAKARQLNLPFLKLDLSDSSLRRTSAPSKQYPALRLRQNVEGLQFPEALHQFKPGGWL
jgi:hypothetical protein